MCQTILNDSFGSNERVIKSIVPVNDVATSLKDQFPKKGKKFNSASGCYKNYMKLILKEKLQLKIDAVFDIEN